MTAIPFSFVGAIVGHLLLGYDLSLMSAMGMVALAGVAVNDSIVLVDAINDLRRKGMDLHEAVTQAGARRLRPIMLTSLTTFFGLMPIILEPSVQARFLVPMAISLGVGVPFCTFTTGLPRPEPRATSPDGSQPREPSKPHPATLAAARRAPVAPPLRLWRSAGDPRGGPWHAARLTRAPWVTLHGVLPGCMPSSARTAIAATEPKRRFCTRP